MSPGEDDLNHYTTPAMNPMSHPIIVGIVLDALEDRRHALEEFIADFSHRAL
jgi:hypothetical protein